MMWYEALVLNTCILELDYFWASTPLILPVSLEIIWLSSSKVVFEKLFIKIHHFRITFAYIPSFICTRYLVFLSSRVKSSNISSSVVLCNILTKKIEERNNHRTKREKSVNFIFIFHWSITFSVTVKNNWKNHPFFIKISFLKIHLE